MRFLFATWDGGGNVLPTLAIARQLRGRGHSVRVLGPRSLGSLVEGAGCAFAAYSRVPERAPSPGRAQALQRARAALLVLELARATPTLAFAQDVLSDLQREPVDVLVVDFMLAGAIAAGERAGVPTAALAHTVYCLPAPGRAPFGPALAPAAGPAGHLRDAAITTLARRVNAPALRDLNQTRERMGLTPVASACEQLLRVERLLVLTTAAFDPPPASLPSNVRYVGPQLDGSCEPEQVNLGTSTGFEPLVVVSFSSRFAANEVVQRVLDALEVLPVRVLLTLGPALAPSNLRVPASAVVRRFVPHERVLPGAGLVVTHAGLGTVMAALAHGVPLLCIPLKNDQFENASRVVAARAGCRLGRHARRSSLKRAILQLLHDPRFKEGAGRMAEAIAAHEDQAVQALEELGALTYVTAAPTPSASVPSPLWGADASIASHPSGASSRSSQRGT